MADNEDVSRSSVTRWLMDMVTQIATMNRSELQTSAHSVQVCRKCGHADLVPAASNGGRRYHETDTFTVEDEGFLRWMGLRGPDAQAEELEQMETGTRAIPLPREVVRLESVSVEQSPQASVGQVRYHVRRAALGSWGELELALNEAQVALEREECKPLHLVSIYRSGGGPRIQLVFIYETYVPDKRAAGGQ